ncbi:MAG: alpha/beta hydrolase [Pirellulaceae bacterium]
MRGKSNRVTFDNGRGQQLAGIMEWPAESPPRAFALFSHCFTCTKDLKATVRVSRRLAEHGFCVLRYDFTGLADSQGDFSKTNFTTNCQDLLAAADFLNDQFEGPALLIGHSLGGTATAMMGNQVVSAKAITTIASPSSTHRLANYLAQTNPEIEEQGSGTVVIGGSQFTLKKQLLDDLRSYDIEKSMGELRLPMLMFHSPLDQTLPYSWGLKMFDSVNSPKSFITLDGSDHLLVNRPDDVNYVADLIEQWMGRYIGATE